jgi:hypothetical protein
MKGRISQSSVDESMDNSDEIVVDHVKDVVDEREDKIKDERRRLDAEIERSNLSGINKEASSIRYELLILHRTLLTDASTFSL